MYKRWQYGSGYKHNRELYRDIIAFGWNNFNQEVVDTANTLKEALQKEREWILRYKSNEPEYGYNFNTNKNSEPKAKTYIKCVETGELFESMAAAGREYGISREAIRVAIGRGHRSAGYHWEKITVI